MWWVKSLLGREKADDGIADVISEYDHALAQAVAADALADARTILVAANKELAVWNGAVDEESRVVARDEIWLLSERKNARRQGRASCELGGFDQLITDAPQHRGEPCDWPSAARRMHPTQPE